MPAIAFLPQLARRRAARLAREEAGSMIIEFSVSVWMLFLVTFLIFEFCMLLYTYSVLGDAAREGVRYAIAHGTDSSLCSGPSPGCADSGGSNVISAVQNYTAVSFHDMSGMTITPAWPDGTSTPSSRVVVTISYPYVPYFNLPGLTPTMHVTAEGRVVF